MGNLYLYDANKINRLISKDEKNLCNKESNIMSYYESAKVRDDRFHVEDRFCKKIPIYVAIYEEDGLYSEFYSGKRIIDLSDSNYTNGVIIDLDHFFKYIIPMEEKDLEKLFFIYDEVILKDNFTKFVKLASKEYVVRMQEKDTFELKETERIGKAMAKMMVLQNK